MVQDTRLKPPPCQGHQLTMIGAFRSRDIRTMGPDVQLMDNVVFRFEHELLLWLGFFGTPKRQRQISVLCVEQQQRFAFGIYHSINQSL